MRRHCGTGWAPAAHHSNTLGSDLSRKSTDEIVRFRRGIRASLDHELCLSIRHWRRIGSGISGGSESSDYFLTNGFAHEVGGARRHEMLSDKQGYRKVRAIEAARHVQ